MTEELDNPVYAGSVSTLAAEYLELKLRDQGKCESQASDLLHYLNAIEKSIRVKVAKELRTKFHERSVLTGKNMNYHEICEILEAVTN